MARIAVGEVWGIGRRIAERLAAMGIHSALDLKHADPRDIKRQFNVVVERTVAELNGVSCLALEDVAPAKQQIIASRSFAELVHDFDTLASAISHHACRAAEKLRRQPQPRPGWWRSASAPTASASRTPSTPAGRSTR